MGPLGRPHPRRNPEWVRGRRSGWVPVADSGWGSPRGACRPRRGGCSGVPGPARGLLASHHKGWVTRLVNQHHQGAWGGSLVKQHPPAVGWVSGPGPGRVVSSVATIYNHNHSRNCNSNNREEACSGGGVVVGLGRADSGQQRRRPPVDSLGAVVVQWHPELPCSGTRPPARVSLGSLVGSPRREAHPGRPGRCSVGVPPRPPRGGSSGPGRPRRRRRVPTSSGVGG